MQVVLGEYLRRLGTIRRALDDSESINRVLSADAVFSGTPDEISWLDDSWIRLRDARTDRRRHEYSSCIALLYGAFEQFFESLIVEFLDDLGRVIPAFDDLPKEIRQNHADLSARLIINASRDKYRERVAVANIATRIAENVPGRPVDLNSLAYVEHSRNLRFEVLDSMLKRIGVPELEKDLVSSAALQGYWDLKFSGTTLNGLGCKVLFEDLDDLVQRRNIVAHSWSSDIALLSVASLRDMVDFMSSLGEGIHEVLVGHLVAYEAQHFAFELPHPLKVLRKHRVACFQIDAGCVCTESRLAVLRPGARLPIEARVVELQVDDVSLSKVVAPPALSFGCLLDVDVSQGCRFYVIMDRKRDEKEGGIADGVQPTVVDCGTPAQGSF